MCQSQIVSKNLLNVCTSIFKNSLKWFFSYKLPLFNSYKNCPTTVNNNNNKIKIYGVMQRMTLIDLLFSYINRMISLSWSGFYSDQKILFCLIHAQRWPLLSRFNFVGNTEGILFSHVNFRPGNRCSKA